MEAPPCVPLATLNALVDIAVTEAALGFPELLCAWADTMDTFGPDNFSTLQRCVRDEVAKPSLKTALATLRMACWDSDVFYKFRGVLIEATPGAAGKLQADIGRDVRCVAARYFPLQATKDVSFDLGRILMGLRAYSDAIASFHASRRQCGDHHVTWYNIGICHWYLEEWPRARDMFAASLALRPDYADAASWRDRVEAKLQGLAFLRAEADATAAAAAGAAAGGEGGGSGGGVQGAVVAEEEGEGAGEGDGGDDDGGGAPGPVV